MPLIADLTSLLLIGLAALLLLGTAQRLWAQRKAAKHPKPLPCAALLLFEEETLIVHEGTTDDLLAGGTTRSSCFSHLAQRFPDFPERLAALGGNGQEHVQSLFKGESLVVLIRGELCRIELHHSSEFSRSSAETREIHFLREALSQAPQMMWRSNAQGQVIWANTAYLSALPRPPKHWPLPQIFTTADEDVTLGKRSFRQSHILSKNGETLFYASETTAEHAADQQRKKFLNGLADIYAGLPFGIAIFDDKGFLLQFNPALTELTGLSMHMLMERPSLANFLAAMRDNHSLPEPRHYTSWAAQFTSAEDGYSEHWYLPQNRSLEVLARRYPAGLFALVLQDTTLKSHQKTQLNIQNKLLRASLRHINAPVALFDAAGVLNVANPAYNALRGHPDTTAIASCLEDECAYWRNTLHLSLIDFSPQETAHGKLTLTALSEGGTLLQFQAQIEAPESLLTRRA